MRGKVAKRLRKKIYADKDYREREYTDIIQSSFVWMNKIYNKITKISDKERAWYQNAKQVYRMIKNAPKQKKERGDESNTSANN